MVPTPEDFIARHVAEVEPLDRDIALAYWDASLSGKPEDYERAATLEKRLVDIYGRADEYRQVCDFRDRRDGIADALVARQIDVLYRAYRGTQGDADLLKRIVDLETDLARQFNTFRAEIGGEKRTNNQLEQTLKTTRDSDTARQAWQALKQVGRMAAPRILELVELRNRHARDLGSPNYYAFALELGELDLARLFDMLGELADRTDPPFNNLKSELDERLAGEFDVAPKDLRPWHYRNPFFQEMPPEESVDLDPQFASKNLEALTRAYYDGIGLDIAPILERSDLYEKEGKDQHAFCIGVQVPHDVRVLCNLRPSSRWMSTMLHEFGHAVYDRYVGADLPFLLRRPAHTLTTEAVAMLNERFMQTSDFLAGVAGIERRRAEEIQVDLARHQQRKLLVFTRWVLVMTHFERAMYEDPTQDLNARWWDVVERYQGLAGDERRAEPDWAAKIHLACAPVYYQNYLLGEINASQMLGALRRATQGKPIVGNPDTGAFLRDRIFAPGGSLRWDRLLRQATGEALNIEHFLRDLGA